MVSERSLQEMREMHEPERCEKCGAEPEERKRYPRCGEAEWVLQHAAHYMQGAREVIICDCPALHSALGKRMREARVRPQARELTGKRPRGRPGKDHQVTTPEMAKKAAEGLVGVEADGCLAGSGVSRVDRQSRHQPHDPRRAREAGALIVDDPYKDHLEAHALIVRERCGTTSSQSSCRDRWKAAGC